MIVFLHTAEHVYTHRKVAQHIEGVRVERTHYGAAFSLRMLPRATYVFTDLDRLAYADLALAAELYRILKAGGARVLNDPARAQSRYGLLRCLFESGVNSFDAYRVEDRMQPERWPVFLRCEGGHEPPISDLLNDWGEVSHAVDRAISTGYPLQSLLIVEYAAEPALPGLYRKLATFRVGDASFADCCVHQDHWMVKYGKSGIAPHELYEDELRIAQENPHKDIITRAFSLAQIEYGRADFGLVDGKPQIYEINLNPTIGFPTEHPDPTRSLTYAVVKSNYLAALAELDTDGDATGIRIDSPKLAPYQKRAAKISSMDAWVRSLAVWR